MKNLFTVKSSECIDLLSKLHTSKPYNRIGIHFCFSNSLLAVAIGYCWLIRQTSPNSLLRSLKYLWWGCFAPPRLLRLGATAPLCPPSYVTARGLGWWLTAEFWRERSSDAARRAAGPRRPARWRWHQATRRHIARRSHGLAGSHTLSPVHSQRRPIIIIIIISLSGQNGSTSVHMYTSLFTIMVAENKKSKRLNK